MRDPLIVQEGRTMERSGSYLAECGFRHITAFGDDDDVAPWNSAASCRLEMLGAKAKKVPHPGSQRP